MKRYKRLSKKRRTRRVRKMVGGIQPTHAKPRVAILFVGRIKGYEHVMANLQKIKNEYNPVVFCSLNKKNKTEYINEFCKLMDITEDRLNMESTPPYPEYMNHVELAATLHGKWGDGDAKQSAYSNFYHLQKVLLLLNKYLKHSAGFDIVLYYRADIDTQEHLNLTHPVKDMTVYVPQNNPDCDYGGLCMSFLYGNLNTMTYFCNIIDSIEDMCKKQGVLYHAETLFKKHMENNRIAIERFPYIFTHSPFRHTPHPVANVE